MGNQEKLQPFSHISSCHHCPQYISASLAPLHDFIALGFTTAGLTVIRSIYDDLCLHHKWQNLNLSLTTILSWIGILPFSIIWRYSEMQKMVHCREDFIVSCVLFTLFYRTLEGSRHSFGVVFFFSVFDCFSFSLFLSSSRHPSSQEYHLAQLINGSLLFPHLLASSQREITSSLPLHNDTGGKPAHPNIDCLERRRREGSMTGEWAQNKQQGKLICCDKGHQQYIKHSS